MLEECINQIKSLYGFSNPNLSRVDRGLATKNYFVEEGGGKYFLKAYDDKVDSGRVQEIFKSMEYFSKNGIPAVMPLSTQSGRSYFDSDGRLYALFPFVDGKILDPHEFNIDHIKKIAKLQGSLHKVGFEFPEKGEFRKASLKFFDYEAFLVEADEVHKDIVKKDNIDDVDKEWIELIEKKVKYVNSNPRGQVESLGPQTLAHGDFHNENIIWNDGSGEIIGLVDFDLARVDFYHVKVLKTIDLIIFERGYGDESYELAQTYLKEYSKHMDLDNDALRNCLRYRFLKRVLDLWPVKQYYKGVKRMAMHLETQHKKFDYLTENFERHWELLESA